MNIKVTIIALFLIILTSIFAGFLAFSLVHRIFSSLTTSKQRQKHAAKNESFLDKWLKKRHTGIFSYYQIHTMMVSTGETFRQRKEGKECETPGDFITESILLGFIVGAVAIFVPYIMEDKFEMVYLLAFIPGAFIGFFSPKFIMKNKDKDDNKKMLSDINNMYETLKVSTTAGIPLINGLGECYRQVKNQRLKSALAEVSAAIRGGKDIESAINHLREQFTSPEIIQFCIVIRQSLATGRQAEILGDLSSNMKSVQEEINHQIEEKLNTKVQLIQMGLLFLLVFVMLYAVMQTLTTQITF